MNGAPTFGWYYRASGDYAPAWTGVPFLYNFLVSNMESGPVGTEISPETAEMGDIIQLGRRDGTFYHTLIVTGMCDGVPLVCAHDNDALDRPLDSYTYDRARAVHISGVRIFLSGEDCCFAGMLAGDSVFPNAASADVLACDPAPTEIEASEDMTADAPPADILPDDFVMPIEDPAREESATD